MIRAKRLKWVKNVSRSEDGVVYCEVWERIDGNWVSYFQWGHRSQRQICNSRDAAKAACQAHADALAREIAEVGE